MKKLMVLVLSLAMMLSMIGAASAAEETLLTGNGSISVSSLEGYDKLTVTITADDPTDTKNGWGLGGLCLDGTWSVTEGFEITSNGEADQTFEWAVADILAAATGDTINVNCYNNFSIVSVVVSTAESVEEPDPTEETVLGSVENPANGTITILNGYTFTEEDIVVRIYISTVDDDHSGWGLGALCSSDWQKNIVELPAGTSAELKVVEMTLKELGDAFTAAGYAATDGVVLNDWADYASVAKIEVVRLAADDPEDPTPSVTPDDPEDPTPSVTPDDPEDPDPTETPEDPSATPTPGTGTEDTPKTGDTMSWVLLAALAVVTLGGVIVSKKARA